MGSLRALILDMDGVLVETETLKAVAHADTVALFGGQAAPSFYATVMGRPHVEVRDAFLAKAAVAADGTAYDTAFDARYAELIATGVRMAPGAADLLFRARSLGLATALVTSSRRWMTGRVLESVGQASRPVPFDYVICADDVPRHKPAPDCYLAALARLTVDGASALAVEDSDSGVAAAGAAGIHVIALRHALNHEHQFRGAVRVVSSLDEVLSATEAAA
jgi:HAD superfamily hydrolase (TIGR01509 family)